MADETLNTETEEETTVLGPDGKPYWALRSGQELGEEIFARVKFSRDEMVRLERFRLWRQMYRELYGLDEDYDYQKSSDLYSFGDYNEYTETKLDIFRNYVRHVASIATTNRPSFDARAGNTDNITVDQTQIAEILLEHYMREEKIERLAVRATELALVFGEYFMLLGWDPAAGPEMEDPDTGDYTPRGEVYTRLVGPWDVYRRVEGKPDDQQWFVVRVIENKWDLATQYPEMSQKILEVDQELNDSWYQGYNITLSSQLKESDSIYVYYLLHPPTQACPNGRYVSMISEDIILYEGDFPYEQMNLLRVAPDVQEGTTLGNSPLWGLRGPIKAKEGALNMMLTRIDATGLPHIVANTGNNVEAQSLADGLTIIKVPEGMTAPTKLDLFSIPGEMFELTNWCDREMESLSGINAVARGDVGALGKSASGSLAALFHQQALQFNSPLQQSYYEFLEDIGNLLLSLLRNFANPERFLEIVGRDKSENIAKFKDPDISLVKRVYVTTRSPQETTTAGRQELADKFVQMGLVNDPLAYLEVIRSGNIDLLTRDKDLETDLIRDENEKLVRGAEIAVEEAVDNMGMPTQSEYVPEVPVLVSDNHPLHIQKHAAELNSMSTREQEDGSGVAATLAHIRHHLKVWQETDPLMLQVFNIPPFPIPPPMPAPMGGMPGEVAPNNLTPPGDMPQDVQAGDQQVPLPNMPEPAQVPQ